MKLLHDLLQPEEQIEGTVFLQQPDDEVILHSIRAVGAVIVTDPDQALRFALRGAQVISRRSFEGDLELLAEELDRMIDLNLEMRGDLWPVSPDLPPVAKEVEG